jgi:hypothetical protein
VTYNQNDTTVAADASGDAVAICGHIAIGDGRFRDLQIECFGNTARSIERARVRRRINRSETGVAHDFNQALHARESRRGERRVVGGRGSLFGMPDQDHRGWLRLRREGRGCS